MADRISQLPRGSSVVEHSPRHPKVEGSNPAISAGGRERETFGGKSFIRPVSCRFDVSIILLPVREMTCLVSEKK